MTNAEKLIAKLDVQGVNERNEIVAKVIGVDAEFIVKQKLIMKSGEAVCETTLVLNGRSVYYARETNPTTFGKAQYEFSKLGMKATSIDRNKYAAMMDEVIDILGWMEDSE